MATEVAGNDNDPDPDHEIYHLDLPDELASLLIIKIKLKVPFTGWGSYPLVHTCAGWANLMGWPEYPHVYVCVCVCMSWRRRRCHFTR